MFLEVVRTEAAHWPCISYYEVVSAEVFAKHKAHMMCVCVGVTP